MLFGSAPQRITEREFKRAINEVASLDEHEEEQVWLIFSGDLDEEGRYRGIDETELEKRIAWMRENQDKHRLDNEEISALEAELREEL